jgi:hypothetical protein
VTHEQSNGRFHGRIPGTGQACQRPGCAEAGEYRAPGRGGHLADGPGEWRWFCLEHVREFNAGYDWFAGMTTAEILRAQSPVAGWETETRAFRPTAGVDQAPRWADFADPLDAINARARNFRQAREGAAAYARRFTPELARAMEILGLAADADRAMLRRRYSDLVRKYHPDRNGGDRAHEDRLRAVVDAYQVLRKSSAFA